MRLLWPSSKIRHHPTIRNSRILRGQASPAGDFYSIVGRRETIRSCITLLPVMQLRQRLQLWRVCPGDIHWLLICCILISSHTNPLLALRNPSAADLPCILCNKILSSCTASELKPWRATIIIIESAHLQCLQVGQCATARLKRETPRQ